MKAELTQEQIYRIKANGVTLTGLRQTSKWNGLVELTDAEGEKLIVSYADGGYKDMFDTVFAGIFRTAGETRDAGVLIVMGSPGILAKFMTGFTTTAV